MVEESDKKIIESFRTQFPTDLFDGCILYVSGKKAKEIRSGAG